MSTTDKKVNWSLLVALLSLVISGVAIRMEHSSASQTNTPTVGLVPTGTVIMTQTVCPGNFSEMSALNGQFIRGTVAANGDVGTTGGNATITPSGTVSQPTFSGTPQNFGTALNVSLLGVGTALTGPSTMTPAGTVSQPTFTGNAVDPSPPFTKLIFCIKN